MCEAVEKYGKECADEQTLKLVKHLMENVVFSLEQALGALDIRNEARIKIIGRLQ